MSNWFSLSGYLNLKFLGGGLTTLIRSKKRYYFVLDEINRQLSYYKEYDDHAKKKNPSGSIELTNCAVTLNENKPSIFVLHTIGGRQYELEAESERSALVWLECLQKRSAPHKRDILSDNVSTGSTLCLADLFTDTAAASISQFEGDIRPRTLGSLSSDVGRSRINLSPASSPEAICSFYFGSWSSSIDGIPNSSEEVPRRPSAETVDSSIYGSLRAANPSAASLQYLVKEWLQRQESETNTKEQRPPITEGDGGQAIENKTVETEAECDGKELAEVLKQLEKYKRTDHAQRLQIEELTLQLRKLSQQMEEVGKSSHDDPYDKVKYLQQQNKFLNAEVIRLSLTLQSEGEEKAELIGAMLQLQKRLEKMKSDYAFLLQSCLRVSVGEKRHDGVEFNLLSFDTHRDRIVQLLSEARKLDPSLPTWECLLSPGNGYVDVYGFRNVFPNPGLALHYAATQLLNFYRNANDPEKRKHWKDYLQRSKNGIANTKEARLLARAGIPSRYRSAIWRCLVHQKVADLKLKYGKYYFRELCSLHGSSNELKVAPAHQKQINLDLLRTMPNNLHFNGASQKGVVQLQAVLQAICAHNPENGYCQGMNFVSAICLLFLNPEDTFWFLVALTERYFAPNYFDHFLTGVQADQEVLKDILEEKLPELAKHFAKREIELTTVTLNWCLALFHDSVPFETLLRIWDCFLLEGPKVLFRFVLALLYMHQKTLLECTDTMSILRALKIHAKHTYHADELVKIAFETLKPFPPRQELTRRQSKYMEILKIRLQRKDELKAATLACNKIRDVVNQIELVVSLGSIPCPGVSGDDLLITYCARGGSRKLAIVSCQTGQLHSLQQEYNCAVVNGTVATGRNIIFMSLLSGDIVSLSLEKNAKTSTLNWSTRVADVVLQLKCSQNGRLYAALANGTLAVFEKSFDFCDPGSPQLYYVPIGAAPLSCLCLLEAEGQIWCGMGGRIVILNAKTLDCLERLTIAGNSVGYVPAVFERLLCLQKTNFGIWMATYCSPLIQLWEPSSFTCKMVFDTSSDHQSLHTEIESRITSMLAFDACVWVGTEDGYILVYDVTRPHSSPRINDRKSSLLLGDDLVHSKSPSPRYSSRRRSAVAKIDTPDQESGYGDHMSSASNEKLNVFPNTAAIRKERISEPEEMKRWRSCLSLLVAQPDRSNPVIDAVKRKNNWIQLYQIDSRLTYSSAEANSTLEYDDSFIPYMDRASGDSVRSSTGGLLLGHGGAKSQSDLNLATGSTSTLEGPDNEELDERSQRPRRQFLRRPTRKELRRKDLDVDEYLTTFQRRRRHGTSPGVSRQSAVRVEGDSDDESQGMDVSDTASVLSISTSTVEPPYPYKMQCVMRLKISDHSIRSLTLSKSDEKERVISSAGRLDENESILVWKKDENDPRLWVPRPVTLNPDSKLPPNVIDRRPLTRRSTTPWFRPS